LAFRGSDCVSRRGKRRSQRVGASQRNSAAFEDIPSGKSLERLMHSTSSERWPELAYADWKDTCATLHLWMQVVGKVRLALTPWLNHSWHVPFYVTARGLSTSPIPDGDLTFELNFDFLAHRLALETSRGDRRYLTLAPMTVAEFYRRVMEMLDEADISVEIDEHPSEIPNAIPFSQDRVHAAYDADYAQRFWRVLAKTDRVMKLFRTGFIGKCSPVHFFWGSFDLAVTRFSGRRAPLHPGGVPGLANEIAQEAYSHEVSSAGFWPGGNGFDASFYSYAYPQPDGYRSYAVSPREALYSEALGEFVLPYAAVRSAHDPDAMLIEFLQSTYEAAAECGKWNRTELECAFGHPRIPRRLQ
jgi:hypothetical protein